MIKGVGVFNLTEIATLFIQTFECPWGSATASATGPTSNAAAAFELGFELFEVYNMTILVNGTAPANLNDGYSGVVTFPDYVQVKRSGTSPTNKIMTFTLGTTIVSITDVVDATRARYGSWLDITISAAHKDTVHPMYLCKDNSTAGMLANPIFTTTSSYYQTLVTKCLPKP